MPIKHSARQVQPSDFKRFTHILASDEANLRSLQHMKPRDAIAEVRLWGSYLDNKPIPDPYYGGMVCSLSSTSFSAWHIADLDMFRGQNGFDHVYDQCVRLSNAFLDDVFGVSTQTVE